MIVSDRFVMINFPKTGSSFARAAIRDVHRSQFEGLWQRALYKSGARTRPMLRELLCPKITDPIYPDRRDQHGTVRQIPTRDREKEIVSIVRDPFSWYLSRYFFRWWVKYPVGPIEEIVARYPNFPDLSFSEYYDMLHEVGTRYRLDGANPAVKLGQYSLQFIKFFCMEPRRILDRIDDGYVEQGTLWRDLPQITFLRQENLRPDLFAYLVGRGYSPRHARRIFRMERRNASPRPGGALDSRLYTPRLIADVLERDKLIFKLFPEYESGAIRLQNQV